MERSRLSRGVSVSASSSSSTVYPKSRDTGTFSYLRANVHRNYASSSISTANSDQEISIFDAEKYFNELSIINVNAPRKVSGDQCRFSWTAASSVSAKDDNYIDSRSTIGRINNCGRARSFHVVSATPTASSEASWNSQTGLLSKPHSGATTNNIAFMTSLRTLSSNHSHLHPHSTPHHDLENTKKKLSGWSRRRTAPLSPTARWFSFSLRRRSPPRCPCSGKKSVQVVDQESKSKINGNAAQNAVLDKEVITTTSTVVSTAANLNSSSSSLVARVQLDADRHYVCGQERCSNWDRHQFTASSTTTSNAAAAFTFPILKLNNGVGAGTSLSNSNYVLMTLKKDQGHTPDSLQVFGGGRLSDHHQQYPSTIQKPHSKSNIAATSSSSSTAHYHQDHLNSANFTFPATPESRIISTNDVNEDDDVGSDASSDLFEIESFSASTATTTTTTSQTVQSANMRTYESAMLYRNYYRTRRPDSSVVLDDDEDRTSYDGLRLSANNIFRRSLDRRPEPVRTTALVLRDQQYCYEPSEASIDWSVTTAEPFDRSDQHDQHHHNQHDHHQKEDNDDQLEIKMSSKRRASSSGNNMGLLSCRREKAVSVGPNPVRVAAATAESDYHCQRYTAVGVGPANVSVSSNPGARHVGSRASI